MKNIFTSAFLLILSFDLWAYTKDKPYKLTILHTNDHHGRFWPNKDGEMGLAARATLIQKLREEIKSNGGHVLLLDAGDVNTGVPQSDLQDAEPDFRGMAQIGYDVMAIGNHEFDKPLQTIFKQREWAGFPFITANIYLKGRSERLFPSHITKEFEDLKVTVFGLTTEDTPFTSKAENSKGLTFRPMVEEARSLVPTLRPHADVLIALTHVGHYPNEAHNSNAPGDVTLARKVPGIDLIVGGHTQKPLFEPDIQNNTIIVQAHEWGKYVGRVDLEFLNGKVTLKAYKLIPVNLKDSAARIVPDSYLESILRPFKERGDSTLLINLGTADAEFVGKREIVRATETNLGNLITRAYKEKFSADLAITNSGGIRDSIYPGQVTYESVLMVLPFGGEVGTVELSGKDLISYLEYIIFTHAPGSGSFPQMSGVQIRASRETKKITGLRIAGNDVNPSRSYKIAIPEFIALGGDKYPVLPFKKVGYVDADILKDYVLRVKDLKAADFKPSGYLVIE
ncbi:MAG TPA: 5'-nucleotidase C-terminal domain-containing protein [Bacteriovoracaceae bacterium]|nr:5'-nucleotidase C-terminal domain-containing protein [Bacteriovoracaceae bacterium]